MSISLRVFTSLILSSLVTGLSHSAPKSTPDLVSQAPNPGLYSPARFAVQYSLGNRVPMRDGVRLSVDTYSPDTPGQHPALLMITPYDNNSSWLTERAKWFAKRGYIAVLADTRGRYDSDGEWDPFNPKQKTDGYDLVEWIAKQPWCTGRVGMYGPSYMGWETWWTATQAPPSLKAIVPEVAPADPMRNVVYTDGVVVGGIWGWPAEVAGRTNQKVNDGPFGFPPIDRLVQDLKGAPYRDLTRVLGVKDAPWLDTLMRENLSTAKYWGAIAYQTPQSYSRVTVPSLGVGVWFDTVTRGTLTNYVALKRYGATAEARHPRMVIGPWGHWPMGTRELAGIDYGPDAAVDWNGYVTRFLDHYLKGVDNGVQNDPPVHVFVLGANRWRAESDWPLPQTKWTKYYLQSKGRANSQKGDGVLALSAPRSSLSDTYVYDPAQPTLQAASADNLAEDTTTSSLGDDVLVYQTPPLSSAVEVVGPIEATLYASTSARDTDWFVRLVDVQPDGRALLLADGAMRARSRDPRNEGRFDSERLSAIEPGKVYQYTIEFWRPRANLFRQGHRIRVEISSSWFPGFLPNRNSGADNLLTVPMSEAVIAKQAIYHGPKYPSHILLPVIPVDSDAH